MIINKCTSQYFRSSESCVERFSYFVRAIRKEGRKEGRKEELSIAVSETPVATGKESGSLQMLERKSN